jgi:catechol 2,3-dioxygenase-like lactoylglutathione lyase family enzyme
VKKLALALALLGSSISAQQPVGDPDPGLKTLTQICIVCRDLDACVKRWATALGVPVPTARITRPGPEVKELYRGKPSTGQARIANIRLGQVTLELLQPVGPDTSWKDVLDEKGETVHHIAFAVQDVPKTVDRFQKLGMPVIHQGRFDGDNGTYTYLDSTKSLGVIVELLHSEGPPRAK